MPAAPTVASILFDLVVGLVKTCIFGLLIGLTARDSIDDGLKNSFDVPWARRQDTRPKGWSNTLVALADHEGKSVKVVPVRMTESWLLSCESAIRGAAPGAGVQFVDRQWLRVRLAPGALFEPVLIVPIER